MDVKRVKDLQPPVFDCWEFSAFIYTVEVTTRWKHVIKSSLWLVFLMLRGCKLSRICPLKYIGKMAGMQQHKKVETSIHRCAAVCLLLLPLRRFSNCSRGWKQEVFSKVSFIPHISSKTGLFWLLEHLFRSVLWTEAFLSIMLYLIAKNVDVQYKRPTWKRARESHRTSFLSSLKILSFMYK